MSLAADPNQTYDYVLESDRQLPKEKQPVFFIKFLTTRQWRQLVELREKIKSATTVPEINEMVIGQVKPNILGWKNIKNADGTENVFAPEKTEEVLSVNDMYEMMSAEANRQTLDPEAKKKLELQSLSDSDSSVKTAPVL